MSGEDFSVTAGWGHFGTGDAVMPGQGRVEERPYTATESAALGDLIGILSETTGTCVALVPSTTLPMTSLHP